MIDLYESKWIFPDGTEYDCERCGHSKVVEEFIRGLRFFDLETCLKIRQSLEVYETGSEYVAALIRYGVEVFGWIMVHSAITPVVKYAGTDWQRDIVKRYEDMDGGGTLPTARFRVRSTATSR